MGTMDAAQHVYVVKVRTLPDPSLLFPSERRYSALTVAGLAAGHALLGAVALLLGALALSWDPPEATSAWAGHLGAGLWLGLTALQAALCGLLAWRRWYEDRYITWFFRSSLLAAFGAAAGLALTSAALAHLHENLLSPQPRHILWPTAEEDIQDSTENTGTPWLDLPDSNSSTISSGGLFADLVRDQDHEDDLLAADSTQPEQLVQSKEQGDTTIRGPFHWAPLSLSPRTSAQIRSLVGVNVLVASLLELLWSLLGARLAWRGMRIEPSQLGPPSQPGTTVNGTATSVPSLERGAADGKVDVDSEKAELRVQLKQQSDKSRTGMTQRQEHKLEVTSPVKLHQRRRAPDLPELSLEHRTMDLEERVARFLDRSHNTNGCAGGNSS